MLKTLRRKFVVIIMMLTGIVLLSVLGGTYISTWNAQHEIIEHALQRGIDGSLRDKPRIGEERSKLGFMPEPDHANVLVLSVDLDANGVVLATNEAPVLIDSYALTEVVDEALACDEDARWDQSSHIAWRRAERESGAWRIVIADTSATDITLQTIAIRNVVIFAVAMLALLCISIALSAWVLRPVERAWQQQRRFVADASHELKTPLAVIMANTQILERDEGIPLESRRWVESTAEESAHMKGLVEELLELARTDERNSGAQGVMRSEPVDFSSMVENAALEFEAIAFDRGILMDESIAEGIRVTGDPDWLQRLCKILIDNACKYAFPDTCVTVGLVQEGRKCLLSVNNKGNTIDPQDIPHLFDRFYRTDKARSRSGGASGFGLGLAIAKGIATSHGGDITVSSNDQQGTTFCVTLPVMP